jgi:hypothetical protein
MTATEVALLNLPQGTPPQLISAIEDAIHDTLNHHGAGAFEAPREAAIFHEVGHAIVGTHEGIRIREITISSRSTALWGRVWGGRCLQFGGTWTTGPDTSADDDLHRARMIIAGLAAETLTGTDRPGSSLDELALSQLVGINAAVKLGDPTLSDDAHSAYVEELWHERVWGAAVAILRANHKPFFELAECLNQKERVRGWKLHKILAQMERITL